MSNKVSIVMYHYARDLQASRYPGIKGLDLKLFREQIDFLKARYTFINCGQLLESCIHGADLPENSIFLTFDDGYIDHYTNVFPILKENNIQGFFSMPGKILAEGKLLDVNKIHFILASLPIGDLMPKIRERLDFYQGREYTIPPYEELYDKLAVANRFDTRDVIFIKRLLQVELDEALRNLITDDLFKDCVSLPEQAFAKELYMSYDQIKLMRREGMVFGIHGYEHYWMNRLSPEALENDIKKALDVFAGIVPEEWICCYPYGSHSDSVIDCVKRLGAAAGLSTEVKTATADFSGRYLLARFDTNDFPPVSERYLKFSVTK